MKGGYGPDPDDPQCAKLFPAGAHSRIIVLYAKNEVWWAFGMLVLSGVTDVVDGWVARTYHMVSNFGKAIDPVADKLTQIAVLLCLMPMKCWWVVGILVLKEVSIGHHDAPDPAPHRHGLRRGLVRASCARP